MSLRITNTYDRNDLENECIVFEATEDLNLNKYSIGDSMHTETPKFQFHDQLVKKGTPVYLYTRAGDDITASFRGSSKHILFCGSDKALWKEGNDAQVVNRG